MISRRSGDAARTSRAAGTATAAPWSPLMASTAIVSPAVMRGPGRGLFLAFVGRRLLDHLLAAIETVGRDAMTQVRLAAGAVDRQRGAASGDRANDACRAWTGSCGSSELPWSRLLSRVSARAFLSSSSRRFAKGSAYRLPPALRATVGQVALAAARRTARPTVRRHQRHREQHLLFDQPGERQLLGTRAAARNRQALHPCRAPPPPATPFRPPRIRTACRHRWQAARPRPRPAPQRSCGPRTCRTRNVARDACLRAHRPRQPRQAVSKTTRRSSVAARPPVPALTRSAGPVDMGRV
jgi:hypothetical protein